MDLGKLGRRLAELRERLDHSFLNDLEGLGKPTLENLCAYIWRDLCADSAGSCRSRRLSRQLFRGLRLPRRLEQVRKS